jgi:glycosyltransferase involved in cell wall biosynthesis
VVVTHHQSYRTLPMATLGRKDQILRHAVRWAYPRADAVVAVSQQLAGELEQFLGQSAGTVQCLYNPVIGKDLAQLGGAALSHPWFATGQPPVIVGVGRLALQKDFANLLQAFALLRQRRPARLMVLGEGPLRADLQQLAEQLGVAADVALPGFDPNPYRFLSRAAVFALSSQYEGLPTVLIEALALGTPVVATDCQTGPREILQGGVLGRLVPVGDAAALAEALGHTLDAPRQPVDPAVLRPYHHDEAAGRYRALFERVVAQRSIT